MRDEDTAGPAKNGAEGVGGKCVSVEDLNDALRDDTDDSEAEGEIHEFCYIELIFILIYCFLTV